MIELLQKFMMGMKLRSTMIVGTSPLVKQFGEFLVSMFSSRTLQLKGCLSTYQMGKMLFMETMILLMRS